jgi:DNA topoisomerase-1
MPLVIVESPAKCQKIKSFLGADYDVVASMGHIRALEESIDAVGIDRDFEPRFEFMKDKSKTINQLKESANKHSLIILAADDDREGEAIAYSIALLLKQNPATAVRAVFHEITSAAVTNAIKNPRTLNMDKVFAQQSRAVLDMLVGFTISRCLWNHVGHSLSAGRCQTPALRLVVEKEESIASFSSTQSWKVSGSWSTKSGDAIYDGFLTDDLEDEESASNYIEMQANHFQATILSIQTRNTTENPPLPLITSSLQQQASNLLRTNPKNTMKIAQRLYEAGHITYMRTDKAVLGVEATQEGRKYITETFGPEYLYDAQPKQSTQSKAKTKSKITNKDAEDIQQPQQNAQEAHEAIRPTHIETLNLPTDEDWSVQDRKLYKLIWTRTIQSLMAPSKGETRAIDFRTEVDDTDWTWRINLSHCTFDGWKRLNTNELKEEQNQTKESLWLASSSLKLGQTLYWKRLQAEPHFTKAPSRYSEASLIKELEEKGIGRPSTFASLISTILDKTYVEKKDFEPREVNVNVYLMTPEQSNPEVSSKIQKLGAEKDRLVPTPLGLSVIQYLLKNFQNLFNYSFTASMEQRLDSVAEGSQFWKDVLRDTWNSYKDIYNEQVSSKTSSSSTSDDSRKKVFDNNVIAIITKKGPLLLKEGPEKTNTVFYGWPENVSFQEMTQTIASKFIQENNKKNNDVLGTYENKEIVKKKGPYGYYIEYNGKKIACSESTTYDEAVQKLQETSSNTLKVIGDFEIRKGPYGNYMFKHTVAKKQFVSVPSNVNIDELTIPVCIAMFQHGLQQKAKSKSYGSKPQGTQSTQGQGLPSRGGYGARGRGGFGRGRGRGK